MTRRSGSPSAIALRAIGFAALPDGLLNAIFQVIQRSIRIASEFSIEVLHSDSE